MLCLLFDEAERCHVPEGRGAADAEDYLVPFRSTEELAEALTHGAHEVLDRGLAVGRAKDGLRCSGQGFHLLWADLGRSGAEASVLGQQVGGNGDAVVAHAWLQCVSVKDGEVAGGAAPSTPQFCLNGQPGA